MTPKEKASELVEKMYFSRRYKEGENYIPEQAWIHAKQCALYAVDELMELAKKYETKNCRLLMDNLKILYWQEVKREIEKL